jgi:hypothetical protein
LERRSVRPWEGNFEFHADILCGSIERSQGK